MSHNSGTDYSDPGDLSSDDYLFEHKTKMKEVDSMVVHRKWLEEIQDQGAREGKTGVLVIDFGVKDRPFVVMTADDFMSLVKGEAND